MCVLFLLESQLKEELTVARSEKDSEKCGVILKKLSRMAKIRHDDSACERRLSPA
ncbi:MAG: hypothetical protein IJL18_01035 [Synergistaceae bacterium]|nr:hypothetical protein [Synergistaceae bacterium]MBR0279862.1 hypothetical protein [Synergistaceae bacterium]